jgi:hypothetical protein
MTANGVIYKAVDEAFRAAFLLTGSAEAAEYAVLDGIAALELGDIADGVLLVETVKAIIQKRADFPGHSEPGRTPRIDGIGIAYMYVGAWVKGASADHEFHLGPHLMVVGPHQDEFQGFNRDASTGMPSVTHLPNRTELFLVMPIRQWDER